LWGGGGLELRWQLLGTVVQYSFMQATESLFVPFLKVRSGIFLTLKWACE
jgi:hypothetical protein